MTKNIDDMFDTSDELQSNVMPFRADPAWDVVNPMSFAEIVVTAPKALEYAMFPWLPIQGIAFIYAATGVGKTLFTLNVAYAIADGGKFLKYTCPKPRRVLYVDGEMAYTQIHGRLMDIVRQQGTLERPENFFLFTPDKTPIRPFKICQPEGQAFYDQKIEQNKIEVVVLDNLSMLSMFDENSSAEWKAVQDWLLSLRARGVTVVVVHHAGKDKFGYRGTSRMLDCADTAISLQDVSQNDPENERARTKKFKIEYHKTRNFGGKDAFPFEVTLTPEGWDFESMEKNNTQRIIEMVRDFKMKPQAIAVELGVKQISYVYRIIREAKKKGRLKE